MRNMPKKADFIIIDDCELDCFIAEKLVKHAGVSKNVKKFIQATEALDYIKSNSNAPGVTVVLLDILMPVMSGVEFMEEFEKLPRAVKDKYCVMAFTSSMNKRDMIRMQGFKDLKHIFDKPVSEQALLPIISECLS
jgi:CheY-like chemotaxis protein